ncbi:MAG: hypothetical protein JXR94_04405 [Candidatus Hydrogenedentes bacterium]|nr:hypothetical protein [Candidatus Hydrogenedentota bacterium]
MEQIAVRLAVLAVVLAVAFAARTASAATEDLGNGFRDHGIATAVSNHRGTVATVDGDGRNVVLVWLFDRTGGYALLMIDAATGKSEQHPTPWNHSGDCPYSSILSSGNKYYTQFNNHFCEFDPVKRAFTFVHETAPQMAMGMTEDDTGVIWAVSYPQSGVVSFNPETRDFKDYGHVYKQNWAQYQRYVAADDAGWIYFGIGSAASQIIAFDPATGAATPIVPENERGKHSGYVVRDLNGKVYGRNASQWYELYKGQATKIDEPKVDAKPIITSSQGLFHREFPDGKRLVSWDLGTRTLSVEDPATGQVTECAFDYTSTGAHIMGVAAAPDNTICGGTAFPMRFFSYNPETDEWANRPAYCQCNTVARQGDRFYVGGYTHGHLLEWDPAREWVDTVKDNPDCNPLFLIDCGVIINRPHELLAHGDRKTLIMGGTPGYGHTGGGLLFWDCGTRTATLLEQTDLLPDHSTMSLAALLDGKVGQAPDRTIVGGTTTAPGSGGEKKATVAELYIIDKETKQLEWHAPLLPGVREYTDLCTVPARPERLVYGFADRRRFFVFDAETREIVHEEDTEPTFGLTCYQQGPRVFVKGPHPFPEVYILFGKGIARVDQKTHAIEMLAESPVSIDLGGDFLNGRIYFGSGSHVYSYQLPE